MALQEQNSSFAKKLGGAIAAANAEHRDKPIDTGVMRLPGGIKNGVAKLVTMVTKEYQDDKMGPGMKGQTFFRAAAVVVYPKEHAGIKCEGLQTSQIIPICATPAKGQRKARTLSENWFDFQNLFKLCGVPAPPEDTTTDPTGQKTEAYYFAAMRALTDPKRPGGPVYIAFSTREWKSPKLPNESQADYERREPMVFETWHGLADLSRLNGAATHDPASGVTVAGARAIAEAPAPFVEPPMGTVDPQSLPSPDGASDELAGEVADLVDIAMNDPTGETSDGQAAHKRLEELAWAAGWDGEATAAAGSWAEVGEMCLCGPAEGDEGFPTVEVGSQWLFARRDRNGAKLKDRRGAELPAVAVEVIAVDEDEPGTCRVKACSDGMPLVDARTKKPIAVKLDWLEPLQGE